LSIFQPEFPKPQEDMSATLTGAKELELTKTESELHYSSPSLVWFTAHLIRNWGLNYWWQGVDSWRVGL